MKLLAVAWASYRERVLPVDADPIQVLETRRAFYAGAASLLTGIMKMLDPGDEPTDADVERMRALENELMTFVKDVAGGRA